MHPPQAYTIRDPALRALVTKCERGKGGDRELDAEIDAALFGGVAAKRHHGAVEGPGFGDLRASPPLTTSVDACLELAGRVILDLAGRVMPRGCAWHVTDRGGGDYYDAALQFAPGTDALPYCGSGYTPARALLAAILRAKAAACEAQG